MKSLMGCEIKQNFHGMLTSFLGESFGLNTNILETNLINLAIVIGVGVYLGGEFLESLLTTRKNSILKSLQDIENRYKQTAELFDQVKLENEKAKEKAKSIRDQAILTIEKVKNQLNNQFAEDIEKLEQTKIITIEFEKQKILTEIRQQISQLAFQKASSKLQSQLTNSDSQRKLIDQRISLLSKK